MIKKQQLIFPYLTDKEISDFQALCKKVYGLDLTWGQAEDQATRFAKLMELLIENQHLLKN